MSDQTMSTPITLDTYSLVAVPVETYFNEQPLGCATAFAWQAENAALLITNWHVVTGKDAFTKEHVNRKTLAEPNKIRCYWDSKQSSGKQRVSEEFELRGPNGEAQWWVHPQYGNDIDVVAFPLKPHPEAGVIALNKIPEQDLAILVGMDVFVIGYPFGPDGTYLPIWKRGSIASEPDLVGPAGHFLYIDTATRRGMSGAPVIRRSYGTHAMTNGSVAHAFQCSKFVGVYSGRKVGKDPFDAQLGMVWPACYLEEIVAGRKVEQ
jgi:Trypsin-like peptidase domain